MYYADETNILEDRVERAEAEVARLREALEAQAFREDIKTEWYRQSDLGQAPSEKRWESIGFEHVAGARQRAIILRIQALSTTDADRLEQHDAEVRQEVIDYLWKMWWPTDSWEAKHKGCLTANALWMELNMARDREKNKVRVQEREQCVSWIRQFAEMIDSIRDIDDTKGKARHVLLLAADGIGDDDEIPDSWLKQHDAEVRREERGQVFHTVQEIMEHYVPKDEGLDGHAIAARLLKEFRAAIHSGIQDATE